MTAPLKANGHALPRHRVHVQRFGVNTLVPTPKLYDDETMVLKKASS